MEQGGCERWHGSAWHNMGRLPGGGGLQAEPQPLVLGSRALGQRPKTAHQRPPKARLPPTGWQPPEWTARAQSGWHIWEGPACAPDIASFSPLFLQQMVAPTPHRPTPPQGQHYDPPQGLTRPAQILGRMSFRLWSQAALAHQLCDHGPVPSPLWAWICTGHRPIPVHLPPGPRESQAAPLPQHLHPSQCPRGSEKGPRVTWTSQKANHGGTKCHHVVRSRV